MESRLRKGEITAPLTGEAPSGPALHIIGTIHTPWTDRADCPRQGNPETGPDCQIELFSPWERALAGIEAYARLEILYWLDRSRRDLLVQNPKHDGAHYYGTFALRSPQRPNPIGLSRVSLVSVAGNRLTVRGLDCLSGTPLIDIKPNRCEFTPKAPAKPAAG